MRDDPYTGSDWHCASPLQAPQSFVVTAPQMKPVFEPVQSALVPWQLPSWQMPW